MNKIKIFLASSIVELANERKDLELFIRNTSDKFEEKYDTKILPLLCENIDPCMSKTRKQDEYNELIKDCEMCFFIFFTRAGEFTKEEFNVAFEHFKNNNKPKIYVYFKNIRDNSTVEESVKDFMMQIDQTYHHYYGTFDHIDTIKLRILLNLIIQEIDYVNIETKDGKCLVDGREIMDISNISEFANSQELQKFKTELADVEQKYLSMKAIYASGDIDDEFRKEYVQIAAKRQNLSKVIEELQKDIFELSLNLSKDEVHGNITPRMKEAYRLFELGDSNGCLAILSSDDIDSEFDRWEKEHERESKIKAELYVREHKLAIDILQTMKTFTNRFDEIHSRYEKAVKVAEKYRVELRILCNYAAFLLEQNDIALAITYAEKLYSYYGSSKDIDENLPDIVNVDRLLGALYRADHRLTDAQKHYEKEQEYYFKQFKFKPDSFSFNIKFIEASLNLGGLYLDMHKYDKAKTALGLARSVYSRIVDSNFAMFGQQLAGTLLNLGLVYSGEGQNQEAERVYLEAYNLFERLAEQNPEQNESYMAGTLCNLGNLYRKMRKYKEAEDVLKKAYSIYEKLAEENPRAFEPNLAKAYSILGSLYCDIKNYKDAEIFITKAQKIFSTFTADNLYAFRDELAYISSVLWNVYLGDGRYTEAEQTLIYARDSYVKLAEQDPDQFEPKLAVILINLCTVYEAKKQHAEAEGVIIQVCEIYERLNKRHPNATYEHDLAKSFANLGKHYFRLHRFSEAEKAYIKSRDIYVKLVTVDQSVIVNEFGAVLSDLAFIYQSIGMFDKADSVCIDLGEIYSKLSEQDPDLYEPSFAEELINIYVVYRNAGRYKEAERLLIQVREIYKRLSDRNSGELSYKQKLAQTITNQGLLYQNLQRYDDAGKAFIEAHDICAELAALDPENYEIELANAIGGLGNFYCSTKIYDKAEYYCNTARQMYEKLCAKKPDYIYPLLAITLSNLSGIYIEAQQYSKAEDSLIQARDIYSELAAKNPDKFESDLATALLRQYLFYEKLKRNDDLERVLIQLDETYERFINRKHNLSYKEMSAEVAYRLGELYMNQHKYIEAETAFLKAINHYIELSQKHANPTYNQKSVNTMITLGRINKQMKEYAKAEAQLKKAYDIVSNYENANSIDLTELEILKGFADIYWSTKRYDDAEIVLKQAEKIYDVLIKQNPDRFEPEFASMLGILYTLYQGSKRFEDAVNILVRVCEIYSDLDSRHPDAGCAQMLAQNNVNLGNAYINIQRYDDATNAFMQARDIYIKLSEENPNEFELKLAEVLIALGALFCNITEQYDNAESALTQACNILNKYLDDSRSEVVALLASALSGLGALYEETERDDEAASLFDRALCIAKEHKDDNPICATIYNALTSE